MIVLLVLDEVRHVVTNRQRDLLYLSVAAAVFYVVIPVRMVRSWFPVKTNLLFDCSATQRQNVWRVIETQTCNVAVIAASYPYTRCFCHRNLAICGFQCYRCNAKLLVRSYRVFWYQIKWTACVDNPPNCTFLLLLPWLLWWSLLVP